jgi:hypothetical protein
MVLFLLRKDENVSLIPAERRALGDTLRDAIEAARNNDELPF